MGAQVRSRGSGASCIWKMVFPRTTPSTGSSASSIPSSSKRCFGVGRHRGGRLARERGHRWQSPERIGHGGGQCRTYGQRICHRPGTGSGAGEGRRQEQRDHGHSGLLEALAIKGCLVSIDAMGTQREIARSIRALGADYLLAVKGNQPTLHEALAGAFVGQWDDVHKVIQTGHGRHVFQIVRTLPNTGQVDTATWVDCALLGRVDSVRVVSGKPSSVETRYYIASRQLEHRGVRCRRARSLGNREPAALEPRCDLR